MAVGHQIPKPLDFTEPLVFVEDEEARSSFRYFTVRNPTDFLRFCPKVGGCEAEEAGACCLGGSRGAWCWAPAANRASRLLKVSKAVGRSIFVLFLSSVE